MKANDDLGHSVSYCETGEMPRNDTFGMRKSFKLGNYTMEVNKNKFVIESGDVFVCDPVYTGIIRGKPIQLSSGLWSAVKFSSIYDNIGYREDFCVAVHDSSMDEFIKLATNTKRSSLSAKVVSWAGVDTGIVSMFDAKYYGENGDGEAYKAYSIISKIDKPNPFSVLKHGFIIHSGLGDGTYNVYKPTNQISDLECLIIDFNILGVIETLGYKV